MDLLKHLKGIFIDTSEETESLADYIDLLVERIQSSYRIEDKIEAVKALSNFAKIRKFKIDVGAKAIDPLLNILENNQTSNELITLSLDCLKHIVSSEDEILLNDIDKSDLPNIKSAVITDELINFDIQFTEIFLKNVKNLAIILKLTEEYDYSVRYAALSFFKILLINAPKLVQTSILKIENGLSRILDLLDDSREIIRNEALTSLVHLSQDDKDLQKIIAFENGFEHVLSIMKIEDFSNGGVITGDCCKLLLNLLKNNISNQTLFREQNYIQNFGIPFLDSLHQTDPDRDFQISLVAENNYLNPHTDGDDLNPQKVANTSLILKLIKLFVSQTLTPSALVSSQKSITKSSLLQKITVNILMASGIPSNLLIQAIYTTAQIIRGCQEGQEFFSNLMAPSNPPKPFLDILLTSMLNEGKPLRLRRCILYFFHSYLYKNSELQAEILSSLLSTTKVNTGRILIHALLNTEQEKEISRSAKCNNMNCWFASLALSYTISNSASNQNTKNIKRDNREILQKVRLKALNSSNENFRSEKNEKENKVESVEVGKEMADISLLQCLMDNLKKTKNLHSKIGMLIFLSHWLAGSSACVKAFLSDPYGAKTINGNITFLTAQISSEHEVNAPTLSRAVQGLAAFAFGLCVLQGDDQTSKESQENLKGIVNKRLGSENYVNQLCQLREFERIMTDQNIEKCLNNVLAKENIGDNIENPETCIIIIDLCVLDQEFMKIFNFYETFILKQFDNANLKKDNYKMDQIDYVTKKYENTIKEKDSSIGNLSEKCEDYKRQLEYLACKYEELNSQMKNLTLQQNQTVLCQNQPPPLKIIQLQQHVHPPIQAFNNSAPLSSSHPLVPFQQTTMQHPQQQTFGYYDQQQLSQAQQNGDLSAMYYPNYQTGGYQNFYMNGLYYDSNFKNFTLTTVCADHSKAGDDADIAANLGNGLSNSIDLSQLQVRYDKESVTGLQQENERLRWENRELQETLVKLQKEQEGFMILMEDYERKLDAYSNPKDESVGSSIQPLDVNNQEEAFEILCPPKSQNQHQQPLNPI